MADEEAAERPSARQPTIGTEIERLFPDGLFFDREVGEFARLWNEPPIFPADVFAAAAYLLEASGAYQYLVAPFSKGPTTATHVYKGPTLAPTMNELARWTDLGKRWAVNWELLDSEVAPYWKRLWSHKDERLVVTPGKRQPAWWKHAHALLVIADEASAGLGYTLPAAEEENYLNPNVPWANFLSARLLNDEAKRRTLAPASSTARTGEHLSRHVARDSLAQQASRDVARVLPKGRTASLGCTFPTLTHNLALLPPHGRSSAYWHQPRLFAETSAAEPGEHMNLLLVPFPYRISEGSFIGETSTAGNGDGPWGRFSIRQKWLSSSGAVPDTSSAQARDRRSLIEFVDRLIREAESDGTVVHGVILPELALDWPTYDALARTVLSRRPKIELLMSGVSADCNGTAGNLVTTSLFHSVDGSRFVETHSRMKHHRWCIDGSQIDTYGLAAELDPKLLWWEFLEVGERVLNIDVIRQSTLTAVICEDLARVDPGLASLRLLGPNLVVALLMDGPQVSERWPGRYATALAEDPGSSVLTLTSLGLIERSNLHSIHRSRSIALWRNYPRRGNVPPLDPAIPLDLEPGSHALLLTLRSERATEATSDGRPNSDAIAWINGGVKQVQLDTKAVATGGWQWIVPEPT